MADPPGSPSTGNGSDPGDGTAPGPAVPSGTGPDQGARGRGAAFFDLDKTVIARASMVAFGRPLYREGLISRTTIVRALYGQLVYLHLGASEQKLARIRDSVLTLTKGWDREHIRRIVRETLEEVVEPISYAEALEAMEHHRQAGERVYLVSASPEEIVNPLTEYLAVDGAIASRPRVDDAGRYTGEMEFYAYGPYKAEAMRDLAEREGIDLAASFAYTDSYTDLPMLEAVGHPVVVNPDRVLSKLARERGWDVRQWERTVALGERRHPPGGTPTVVAAAALVGLGAAGVWWRHHLRRGVEPSRAPAAAASLAATAALTAARRAAEGARAGSRLVQPYGRAAGSAISSGTRSATGLISQLGGDGRRQLRGRQGRRGAGASSWGSRLPGPVGSIPGGGPGPGRH
ncbi:MAG TPA: HAD family hydrolase [Acidimicrobiales bacterium]|nr:HAD family hydrolase [Acidimicrobiales bacterium]